MNFLDLWLHLWNSFWNKVFCIFMYSLHVLSLVSVNFTRKLLFYCNFSITKCIIVNEYNIVDDFDYFSFMWPFVFFGTKLFLWLTLLWAYYLTKASLRWFVFFWKWAYSIIIIDNNYKKNELKYIFWAFELVYALTT